jgi:hypothetical protein
MAALAPLVKNLDAYRGILALLFPCPVLNLCLLRQHEKASSFYHDSTNRNPMAGNAVRANIYTVFYPNYQGNFSGAQEEKPNTGALSLWRSAWSITVDKSSVFNYKLTAAQ